MLWFSRLSYVYIQQKTTSFFNKKDGGIYIKGAIKKQKDFSQKKSKEIHFPPNPSLKTNLKVNAPMKPLIIHTTTSHSPLKGDVSIKC